MKKLLILLTAVFTLSGCAGGLVTYQNTGDRAYRNTMEYSYSYWDHRSYNRYYGHHSYRRHHRGYGYSHHYRPHRYHH